MLAFDRLGTDPRDDKTGSYFNNNIESRRDFTMFLFFLTNEEQWLLYVPPSLKFNNSTFCPHSVFTCFVWISEQTAIISLYTIN